MNKLQSIPLLLLALALACCDLLDSKPDDPLPPGRRDYTWRVDTLHSQPGGWVYDIWGSSPDDVWAVVGTGIHTLWHFDGNEWEPWPERVAPSFYSIYGVAHDDVWAGGSDGRIYHFDGEQWELNFQYQKEGYGIVNVYDIWGTSKSNLYAIGWAYLEPEEPPYVSFLIHYNGAKWQELVISDANIIFQRVRVNSNDTIYIHAVKSLPEGGAPDTLKIYEFKSQELTEILSQTEGAGNNLTMNNVGKDLYFFENQTINRCISGNFIPVITFDEAVHAFAFGIAGRNINDMFINTRQGVFHYNGEDIAALLRVSEDMPRQVSRVSVFPYDIFLVINYFDEGTNLIYHGTLIDKEE